MDEDERREIALAAAPALQPDFHSSTITQDDLNKFKELRRKRLEIKARSKIRKDSKGNASRDVKAHGQVHDINMVQDKSAIIMSKDSSSSTVKWNTCATDQGDKASLLALKKRQKLHWGLDTKERWERKANM